MLGPISSITIGLPWLLERYPSLYIYTYIYNDVYKYFVNSLQMFLILCSSMVVVIYSILVACNWLTHKFEIFSSQVNSRAIYTSIYLYIEFGLEFSIQNGIFISWSDMDWPSFFNKYVSNHIILECPKMLFKIIRLDYEIDKHHRSTIWTNSLWPNHTSYVSFSYMFSI